MSATSLDQAATGTPPARYRLVAPAPESTFDPTPEQQALLDHAGGRCRVLAGPGTGKTATLVEAVARRICSGACSPDQVLVLTFSKHAAAELADRIGRRLGLTVREPIVRTLHSYAYSLLRAGAASDGLPSPRLLGAGESDQMVRELLAGHRAAGGGPWPEFLHPALGSVTFAAELRDLLLRAAERGIAPARMIEWGRRNRRPEWLAAGRFAREYQQVGDLRQISGGLGVALDQAELTLAALAELQHDQTLAREQKRIRRVFVDEYQDVDPAQAKLVEALGSGADELVVLGDPDQSVYQFRGSDPAALRDFVADRTITLTVARRLAPALITATRRIADRLPGPGAHRRLTTWSVPNFPARPDALDVAPGSQLEGLVKIALMAGPAQQADHIADQLRRAHLFAGVPWSRMAVLARSPSAELPALSRAFGSAGVPLHVGADQRKPDDPVVNSILDMIRCGLEPEWLTGEIALALLSSPLGGLDSLTIRRLRRALRAARSGAGSGADLLAGLLSGSGSLDLVPAESLPGVRRLRSMVELAREHQRDPSAERLLWLLWRRCGLESALVQSSERGGRAGQRADRTLDAVVALFELATDIAERVPLGGVRAFHASAQDQEISGARPRTSRVGPEAVTVLSAHSAKGLEWDVVVLVGVQEGSWPDLGARESLLHTGELLDLAVGRPPGVGERVARLAQERRLFYVAATRARQTLICTAIQDDEHEPSRFLAELWGGPLPQLLAGHQGGLVLDAVDRTHHADGPSGDGGQSAQLSMRPGETEPLGSGPHGRHLHLAELIADLRVAVTDPRTAGVRRATAARHLAELAAAGVRGAAPEDWWGLEDLSSIEDVLRPGEPVRLSPSTVESLLICPLRAVLERRGGSGAISDAQVEGIAAHALAHGIALGLADDELAGHLDEFVDGQSQLPPWQRRRVRQVLEAMSQAARSWKADTHPPRRLVGSELELDVVLPAPSAPDPETDPAPPRPHRPPASNHEPPVSGVGVPRSVRVVGRVDWLSVTPEGGLVVTDFKTAAAKPTQQAVRDHPQLATYQVAVAAGAFERAVETVDEDIGPAASAGRLSGGAELVFLRGGVPKVMSQAPLGPELREEWLRRLHDVAEHLAAAALPARQNERCERCPVRSSCPVHSDGTQVTR